MVKNYNLITLIEKERKRERVKEVKAWAHTMKYKKGTRYKKKIMGGKYLEN